MGEVTQADLERLQREVSETRFLVEALLTRPLTDDQRKKWSPERIQEWIDDSLERRRYDRKWSSETWIGKVGLGLKEQAKIEAALLPDVDVYWRIATLEDLSQRTREEVAAIQGVGPRSIKRLDEALAKHGLDWADEKVGA